MTEARIERQLDHLALFGVEIRQHVSNDVIPFAGSHGRGSVGLGVVLEGRILRIGTGAILFADQIDPSISRNGVDPGGRTRAGAVELPGLAPDENHDLLCDFFCQISGRTCFHEKAFDPPGITPEQLGKRRTIRMNGYGGHQGLVRQVRFVCSERICRHDGIVPAPCFCSLAQKDR